MKTTDERIICKTDYIGNNNYENELIAEKNTVRNEKLITTFRNACNQSIYIHNNITLIEHKHNAIKLNLEKCWSIENKTQDVKIECKDGNLLPFILNYCEALFDTFAITKFNTALSDLRELLYNEYTGKEIDLTKTIMDIENGIEKLTTEFDKSETNTSSLRNIFEYLNEIYCSLRLSYILKSNFVINYFLQLLYELYSFIQENVKNKSTYFAIENFTIYHLLRLPYDSMSTCCIFLNPKRLINVGMSQYFDLLANISLFDFHDLDSIYNKIISENSILVENEWVEMDEDGHVNIINKEIYTKTSSDDMINLLNQFDFKNVFLSLYGVDCCNEKYDLSKLFENVDFNEMIESYKDVKNFMKCLICHLLLIVEKMNDSIITNECFGVMGNLYELFFVINKSVLAKFEKTSQDINMFLQVISEIEYLLLFNVFDIYCTLNFHSFSLIRRLPLHRMSKEKLYNLIWAFTAHCEANINTIYAAKRYTQAYNNVYYILTHSKITHLQLVDFIKLLSIVSTKQNPKINDSISMALFDTCYISNDTSNNCEYFDNLQVISKFLWSTFKNKDKKHNLVFSTLPIHIVFNINRIINTEMEIVHDLNTSTAVEMLHLDYNTFQNLFFIIENRETLSKDKINLLLHLLNRVSFDSEITFEYFLSTVHIVTELWSNEKNIGNYDYFISAISKITSTFTRSGVGNFIDPLLCMTTVVSRLINTYNTKLNFENDKELKNDERMGRLNTMLESEKSDNEIAHYFYAFLLLHCKKLHILKILKHVDIIVQSENVSYRYYFKNCTNDLIRLIIPRVLSSKDPDGKIREKFKHTIMTYIGEIEINDLQCEKLDNVYLVEQMHNIDEIFLIIESIISWQMWFESKNNVNILNALFKKCSDNSNYQKKLLDFLIKIYEDILDKYYKIESGEKNIDEDENKTFKDIWISSKWPVQSTIYNNQFKNAYYISFYFIYCLQMYEEKNELWKKIKYVDYDVSDSNFLESVQNFKNECRIPSKTSTSILLWVEFIKRLSVDSIITMNAWNRFFSIYLKRFQRVVNNRTNFDPQIIRKYLKLKKGKSVFNDLNLMAEELNIYYTNLVKKHKLDLFDKYNKEISFQKDNKSLENSITLYNRKISYSQSFCYWLQEERFLDSNMYTLPLPSQYNGDLLTEFVEGDRHLWFFENISIEQIVCKQDVIKDDNKLSREEKIKLILSKLPNCKKLSIHFEEKIQSDSSDSSEIFSYSISRDCYKNIINEMKKLYLRIIENENYDYYEDLEENLNQIKLAATSYGSIVSKHISVDMTTSDSVPYLYHNSTEEVSCRAECKKYLGSCSGEAVLKKRINSVISNEVLKKNMNENMSTRIHLISTIIKNMNIRPVAIIEQFEQITKFYIELKNQFLKDKNEKKLTEICNICGNIFHFLIEIFNECATYDYRINSHIKKSMDMIGNEFIKTDVKNNYILFQYIVNNNCKNSIVCNAFQPITNFNNFVKFYETTINKIEENKFDFTLNLLPKFDIKKWYSLLKGDEEDIKNIYKIIIQSYFKINEMNNSQVDALLTIIKDHFKIIITHTFKTHYHVVLFELLELSKNKINNAQIWSDLYDITKENGEEILKNILIQDVHEIMKLVSNYLMKHRLSLIEKLEIDTKNYTKYNLKSQENQVEMVKQLKNGHIVSLPEKSTLYSFWSKYTTPFSQLFHLISIKSIEMSFSDPTFSILKDDERVSLLWESIITFYEPWIKPIKSTDLNNQYLPWNQNDEINVYEMIEMFFSVIVKLMDTYLDFDINVNNLPLNLALNYYEKNIENSNCLFMNCVYRDQFVKINWKHFQPCESTIMLMTKYCNTNDNKPIIMKILADVDWISISNKILKTEDDNFIRIYHRNLLGVFCHALVDNPIKKNDFYDYINVITNLKSKYIDADSLVAAVTVVMNNLSIDMFIDSLEQFSILFRVLHSLTCNIKYDCSEDDKEQVKSHHMIYVVMITSVVQQLLPKISNHANLTIKLYSMLLEDVTIILSSIPTTNSMKNMDIIYKPIISLLNCVEYNNIQLFINTTIEWMFVLSTNQKTDEKMSNFIERFIALIMLRMYRSDILYSLCNAMMDNFSKETNSFEVIIEHIKESNVNHVHDIIQTALYSCRPILSKRKTLSKIINDTLTKSLLPAKCPITAIVFAVLIKYLRNVYLSDKNKLIEIFKLYSKIIIEFCTDMNQTRYVIILLNDMFSFIDKLVYPDSPLLQELGREIKDFVEIIDVKLLKRHLHSIMPIPLNNATPYVQYMAFVAVFLSANLYSKNNNVRYDSSIHLSQWDLPYSSDFVKFTEKTFKVLLSKKNEQYSTKISQLAIRYIYESSFNLLNIADIMRDLNHLYFS